MKKIFSIMVAALFIASYSFAATFSPVPMTITGSPSIQYSFDGSSVTIPFTLGGTAAAMWLVINTSGQADKITAVKNGYLGWHYVNKIDTTIFISSRFEKNTGSNQIVWDGKDENGNAAAAGTYTYYLWGYDDKTPRQLLAQPVMIGYDWESQFVHVIEKGQDGLPLAQPFLFGSVVWWNAAGAYGSLFHGTTFKWTVGNDPADATLLQTTNMNKYKVTDVGAYGYSYGAPVLNPHDYSLFYNCSVNFLQLQNTFEKWQFVSGGDAILDASWLGWDNLQLEDHGCAIGVWSQKPSCFTDGNYIYAVSPGLHQTSEEWNKLRAVSFDGELVFDKMMHEWYMPDDHGAQGYINGSFHHMFSRNPNELLLGAHTACLHELIDTSRLIADATDEQDMVKFANTNGDYFMDSAYAPTLELKWYCLADDKTTSMRRESFAIDKNGFNVIGAGYLGLTSFGVSTPDGTGVGYMSFADDTVSDDVNLKGGGLLCDSGSAYDGLYFCGALTPDTASWVGGDMSATHFTAFDSFKGVITNGVLPAVEDAKQAAFAVAQNTPNPFNPTTTINFTVPNSNRVTVEVFNVAGQKVDTLVNGALGAGKHSVVWNASGKSAGVYFYTVKAGSFSKTVKMTLLK